MTQIHGEVAEGFGAVGDAFADNFDDRGEVGAAFCLYVGGTSVVDVWGGMADPATGRPWEQDTDRKSGVQGKSVDLGGRRTLKKKKKNPLCCSRHSTAI